MPFYIAGAILLNTAVSADQARKSRKQAESDQRTMLAQQAVDQAAMRTELQRQTGEFAKQGASLEQQAQIARQQFEASQQTYATNKLEMDRKAKEVQEAADEERRKAASAEASALRARTRGGRRSLLSGERMDAELGVPINLGAGGMRLQ